MKNRGKDGVTKRIDGRAPDEMRPVRITPGFQAYAEGSALIEVGQTRVICAASVEERVPAFLKGQGRGWVTAEYAMLPRATLTRSAREQHLARPEGRTQEIQRLVGRSLRGIVDLDTLGERTIIVDCDVLQADGGTRTAAITGAYVALTIAVRTLQSRGLLRGSPIRSAVAAVSAGIVAGQPLLDLCYEEDFRAGADFNIVMTREGNLVEVQGTAEGRPFPKQTVDVILALAEKGIQKLLLAQEEALGSQRS